MTKARDTKADEKSAGKKKARGKKAGGKKAGEKKAGERLEAQRTRHVDEAVSRRFRELREALRLTRTQVAADMGASVSRWQGYERGGRIPASRIWQFCRRYGLEVSQVYAGLPFTIGPVPESEQADRASEAAGAPDPGFRPEAASATRSSTVRRPLPSTGPAAGFAPGFAEEETAFEPASGNPHDPAPDDATLREIAEVAADLNTLERNLALAALRGMRSRKANGA